MLQLCKFCSDKSVFAEQTRRTALSPTTSAPQFCRQQSALRCCVSARLSFSLLFTRPASHKFLILYIMREKFLTVKRPHCFFYLKFATMIILKKLLLVRAKRGLYHNCMFEYICLLSENGKAHSNIFSDFIKLRHVCIFIFYLMSINP